MQPEKVFILASYPYSLINFRIEFIKELTNKNYEVHVGAPLKKRIFK